mmetsp:Transcript_9833/g.29233  ORF Transcript_9833/g.29233 Transcript_9833/m.29233 type:complete len:95 (-) Transcript_9833:561-845(-)
MGRRGQEPTDSQEEVQQTGGSRRQHQQSLELLPGYLWQVRSGILRRIGAPCVKRIESNSIQSNPIQSIATMEKPSVHTQSRTDPKGQKYTNGFY